MSAQHAFPHTLLVALSALGVVTCLCCSSRIGDSRRSRLTAGALASLDHGLSDRCRTALSHVEPAALHPIHLALSPGRRIESRNEHSLGSILGVRPDPADGRMYVLDGFAHRIMAYDSAGHYLRSMGGEGQGPGEFSQLSVLPDFRQNQLALMDDSVLIVRDMSSLQALEDNGAFIDRMHVITGLEQGPWAVLQVASISDSAVLFATTGAFAFDTISNDYASRTSLTLWSATIQGGRIHVARFGVLDNVLVTYPSVTGFPPPDPYRNAYRRRWDAIPSGLVVAMSMKQHGVCFFDRQGAVFSAFRVQAPVVPTNEAERTRILDSLRRVYGPRAPMIGKRWDKVYKWPRFAPMYTDVTLAPDSTAWLQRLGPDGGQAVDLINARTGYLGTTETGRSELPSAFEGRCMFFVDDSVVPGGTVSSSYYGLVKRCLKRSRS